MYTFRRNLTVQKNEQGELVVVLPEEIITLMGARAEGDRFFWKLLSDGSAQLVKQPQ